MIRRETRGVTRAGATGNVHSRVFLDANVLFSAAWRVESGLRALWDPARTWDLVTSNYAVIEVVRNLQSPEQHAHLDAYLLSVELAPDVPSTPLPAGISLPDKDRPILCAAIAAHCTHLLTGDRAHFGAYFGQVVAGVLIDRPGTFLKSAR